MTDPTPINEQSKQQDLDRNRQETGEYMTTNQGVGVTNTNDSVHAGSRGPTLLEDFHLREKMAHFDRERIPERVVHARGSGAHGYFQLPRFTPQPVCGRSVKITCAHSPVVQRRRELHCHRRSSSPAAYWRRRRLT